MMVIDGDVLVCFLRGNTKGKRQLAKASDKVFSAITAPELRVWNSSHSSNSAASFGNGIMMPSLVS